MNAYEAIDLYFLISNRIDAQWALFITFHLALFGGIIYVDRPLRTVEKLGTIVIYTGFILTSYWVIHNQVILMSHSFLDIINFSTDQCCRQLHLLQRLAEEAKDGKIETVNNVLVVSHSLMFLVSIVAIVFDRALSDFEEQSG